MIDLYNLHIYDLSFKLRSSKALKFNLASELNLNYVNCDKNSAIVLPAVRGVTILDSLSQLTNIRATYSYMSDDFKTQSINITLFLSNYKTPFFNFFYKKVLNNIRMKTELSYQSKSIGINTAVTLTNLNMLTKTLNTNDPIASSGIDFGEYLVIKFIFFDKRKSHTELLFSLMGF